MDSTHFQKRFRDLQECFIIQIPENIEELQKYLLELQDTSYEAALQNLFKLTHRFSGNGSVFKFPRISDAARALEVALDPITDEKSLRLNLSTIQTLANELIEELKNARMPAEEN